MYYPEPANERKTLSYPLSEIAPVPPNNCSLCTSLYNNPSHITRTSSECSLCFLWPLARNRVRLQPWQPRYKQPLPSCNQPKSASQLAPALSSGPRRVFQKPSASNQLELGSLAPSKPISRTLPGSALTPPRSPALLLPLLLSLSRYAA